MFLSNIKARKTYEYIALYSQPYISIPKLSYNIQARKAKYCCVETEVRSSAEGNNQMFAAL
jgi:hypothetical protein